MNLWEILKTSKGLPPPDLETLLFARKISGQAVGGSTLMLTASGYPCVLEGSARMPILDYKIYGNSVQDGTPTPENPIEVQSVGDKTANLFNENDVTYGYWITDTGDVSNVVISARYNRDIAVITGKTICVRAYGERPFNIAIGYYDADNAFVLRVTSMNGSLVSTPPANAAYGVVYVANGSIASTVPITPEILASYKIMLTYGESTEYEPYGYAIPVVVTGKNLWFYHPSDTKAGVTLQYSNGAIVFSGVCTESRNFSYMSSLKAGTYTLSTNANRIPVDNGNYCINLYKPNELLAGVFNSNAIDGSITFTISKDIEDVEYRIRLEYGVDYTGFVLKPQLELGTESTAYEPYHAENTNIYLDEQLRKIGDYADVIDYERGVVERKIKKVVFDGSESIMASATIGQLRFTLPQPTVERYGYASHYEVKPIYQNSGFPYVRINTSSNVGLLWFELQRNQYTDNEQAITDFKSYLAEQYDAGTPVTVYHVLADPTTEPISIPSIPTFDGTTVISADTEIQPSNMEIKYKARK